MRSGRQDDEEAVEMSGIFTGVRDFGLESPCRVHGRHGNGAAGRRSTMSGRHIDRK
jgi:hypothetical protein